MLPYSTLLYDTFVIIIDILYWIFDSDDMTMAVAIDIFNDGSQCCRLAASCSPCHKDKSTLKIGDLRKRRRKVQLFKRADLMRDRPEDNREPLKLMVKIDTTAVFLIEYIDCIV
jgi:hypothetical protein